MAEITILHNANCSTSRFAVEAAEAAGVPVEIVKYLTVAGRPDRARLEALVGMIEDPVTDLVRRDAAFARLGLQDEQVATAEQVVEVLDAHIELLQRPVLIRGDRAIIGRPKDRVLPFLTGEQ